MPSFFPPFIINLAATWAMWLKIVVCTVCGFYLGQAVFIWCFILITLPHCALIRMIIIVHQFIVAAAIAAEELAQHTSTWSSSDLLLHDSLGWHSGRFKFITFYFANFMVKDVSTQKIKGLKYLWHFFKNSIVFLASKRYTIEVIRHSKVTCAHNDPSRHSCLLGYAVESILLFLTICSVLCEGNI